MPRLCLDFCRWKANFCKRHNMDLRIHNPQRPSRRAVPKETALSAETNYWHGKASEALGLSTETAPVTHLFERLAHHAEEMNMKWQMPQKAAGRWVHAAYWQERETPMASFTGRTLCLYVAPRVLVTCRAFARSSVCFSTPETRLSATFLFFFCFVSLYADGMDSFILHRCSVSEWTALVSTVLEPHWWP